MGTSRELYMYALEQKKKKLSQHSNMNGVGIWSNGRIVRGGSFPKNLKQDVGQYVESYANASGNPELQCSILHAFNPEARQDCLDRIAQSSDQNYELEKIRAESERLAIEAGASRSMSGGSIALITIGSIAALTGMVILIKKYGK